MADYIIAKYYERFALNVPGVPDSWPQYLKITVVSVRENYRYVASAPSTSTVTRPCASSGRVG